MSEVNDKKVFVRWLSFSAAVLTVFVAEAGSDSASGSRKQAVEGTVVVDNALKAVAAADRAADARWSACASADALRKLQSEIRAKVVAAMGGLPDKCPLDARTVARVVRDGYTIEKVLFASEPDHHVTAHLFLPDPAKFPGKRPGIVIPCGHSHNGKADASYQRGALQSALKGMAALVYDPLDQGERRQNRKVDDLWETRAHNEIGRRAELLGWSMARFRLRDGMRALDYLASRPEVDPSRLGVMGHSGGGTTTSWIMALDDRVRCAAPSGFISTMRDVCEVDGPQDAEQYVFGELSFGFNHLGHILLRAPSPVLMCSSQDDFFPIRGSLVTADLAARVYGEIGHADDFLLSHVLGPHHWHESTRTHAVDWMDRKLQGGACLLSTERYRALDVGFKYEAVDTGLSGVPGNFRKMRERVWPANVTPTGSTADLPGERTVYDLMRDEAARQKTSRSALTPEIVRRVAGIRPAKDIVAVSRDGIVWTDDGTPVPVRVSGTGADVLYVSDTDADQAFPGRRVVTADLRGFGSTGGIKHDFYFVGSGDEELAVLYHLLGLKLVGKRAEDIIAVAKAAGVDRPKLIARGRAVIPAVHAYYTARELFSGIELLEPPPAWGDYLADEGLAGRFADIVRGAWRYYDWTDLQ